MARLLGGPADGYDVTVDVRQGRPQSSLYVILINGRPLALTERTTEADLNLAGRAQIEDGAAWALYVPDGECVAGEYVSYRNREESAPIRPVWVTDQRRSRRQLRTAPGESGQYRTPTHEQTANERRA
jgi:hypothetical protein